MAHRRHSWAVGEAVHAPSVRNLGFSSRRTMIMDERLRELDETRRKARHFGGAFLFLLSRCSCRACRSRRARAACPDGARTWVGTASASHAEAVRAGD